MTRASAPKGVLLWSSKRPGWRVAVLVLLCVLLPLPLLGLAFMSLWPRATPAPQPTNLIPMLSADARRALMTYERTCSTDANCDPPLGCLHVDSQLRAYCTDSTCMTDEDCPGGFACLSAKTWGGKSLVRMCSLMGERKEGERCNALAAGVHLGCARSLLCQAGWCGRACRMDDPSSCPAGFFCSEGREGPPSCLPTCQGRTCPEGQQCVPHDGGASACEQVSGPDCRKTPCPEDHTCKVFSPPQRPWEVRTECRQLCDKDSPCPEGTLCLRYECRKSCEPEGPSACGPGLTCSHEYPSDPWYCMPG